MDSKGNEGSQQQRKVATRSGSISRKSQKILNCMQQFPEGTTPKEISLYTSINVNTVKTILPKLPGIIKIHRGLYKVVNRGDGSFSSDGELTQWNFHNCVLSAQLPDFFEPINISETCGLLNLNFSISSKGRVTLRVSCDTPLNVASLSLAARMLQAFVDENCMVSVKTENIKIKTIEFNKDYSNLRFDGIRCVTVDGLCSQFKAYQKKRGLRLEHKTKVPFTSDNIVEMLTTNPQSLEQNVKLQHQGKQINRISAALQTTNQLLFKLIDSGDKRK